MADALQEAVEALIEQLIEKGKAALTKEQALLDLLTRDGPNASDEASSDSDD
jgi:polyhydroxyalkanoate synthesis regulator phasin